MKLTRSKSNRHFWKENATIEWNQICRYSSCMLQELLLVFCKTGWKASAYIVHQLPPDLRLVQLGAEVRVVRVVKRFRSPRQRAERVPRRGQGARDSGQDARFNPRLHGGVGRHEGGGGGDGWPQVSRVPAAHPNRHLAGNTIHTTAPSLYYTNVHGQQMLID